MPPRASSAEAAAKKAEAAAKKETAKPTKGAVIMNQNVLHSGVLYTKGERVILHAEVCALFLSKGFAVAVDPSVSVEQNPSDQSPNGSEPEEGGDEGDEDEGGEQGGDQTPPNA